MRKVGLGGRDRVRHDYRMIGSRCRSTRNRRQNHDRGNSVRLLRQDDSMPVVVGGDEFDDAIPRHPMTMGRKAGTQCSEDQEQEARQ